jgi:hypothetical protein
VKAETLAELVEQIQALPTSHRKLVPTLKCNDIAERFKYLARDVAVAARAVKPLRKSK